MAFRIATYNIHRCIGRDGVRNPQRIADVLCAMDADLVALQEVAFNPDATNDVLQFLAAAADARAIAGPTLMNPRGRYGNALLARPGASNVQRVDISVPGREPRGAIKLTLEINGAAVAVVATHLGLSLGERRFQMARIAALLKASAADVVVLMGDFNEWLPWRGSLQRLNRFFTSLSAPATFPSQRPILALDRIWIRPPETLTSLRRFTHKPAREASDHLPLVADLAL